MVTGYSVLFFFFFIQIQHVFSLKNANKLRHVSSSTLNSLLNDSSSLLLLIAYTPWCGHCIHLSPILIKVKAKIEILKLDASIVLVDMSQEENKELLRSYPIYGFPSLLLFKSGTLVEGYTGPRTEKYVFL